MDGITIDFNRTMRQADKLDDQSDTLKRMLRSEYTSSMQKLAGDWKGDSASSFFNKSDRLKRDIESTARDLEIIAGNLRRAARRIYEAERRAEEIARQRTHSR